AVGRTGAVAASISPWAPPGPSVRPARGSYRFASTPSARPPRPRERGRRRSIIGGLARQRVRYGSGGQFAAPRGLSSQEAQTPPCSSQCACGPCAGHMSSGTLHGALGSSQHAALPRPCCCGSPYLSRQLQLLHENVSLSSWVTCTV